MPQLDWLQMTAALIPEYFGLIVVQRGGSRDVLVVFIYVNGLKIKSHYTQSMTKLECFLFSTILLFKYSTPTTNTLEDPFETIVHRNQNAH